MSIELGSGTAVKLLATRKPTPRPSPNRSLSKWHEEARLVSTSYQRPPTLPAPRAGHGVQVVPFPEVATLVEGAVETRIIGFILSVSGRGASQGAARPPL